MLENNFKILQKPNNNLNKKVLELLNHLISLPWYYFLYFILFSCILEEVRILKKAWENCVRIQSLNAFCSRWTSPRVLSLRALRAPWPAEQRNTSRSECFYCFGVFDTYFLSPELSVSVQVMIDRQECLVSWFLWTSVIVSFIYCPRWVASSRNFPIIPCYSRVSNFGSIL